MTITDRLSARAVENRIAIAAPAGTVFDSVTDVRRELERNPQLRAEKLTPGPIGPGTRHRVRVTEFPGGCQLAVQTELLAHGVWRVLSPFMRRSWEKDLAAIKAIIEH
jgi:hypothetical protein